MYVTEIKEKQIFERIRWQLRIFESVFYKSLIRACSFENSLAASHNARSNGQTSNHRHCEFVKNALKKCSCLPPDSFKYWLFFYFCHIHERLKIYLLFPHTGAIVNNWMVFSKEIIPANQFNLEHHPQESR